MYPESNSISDHFIAFIPLLNIIELSLYILIAPAYRSVSVAGRSLCPVGHWDAVRHGINGGLWAAWSVIAHGSITLLADLRVSLHAVGPVVRSRLHGHASLPWHFHLYTTPSIPQDADRLMMADLQHVQAIDLEAQIRNELQWIDALKILGCFNPTLGQTQPLG